MRYRFKGVLQTVAVLWLTGALQLAMAQVQTNNSSQPTGGLEEIVVTAQRRSQSLQDVPIAVTAVTSERLDALGIQTMEGLDEVTPGLTVRT